MTIKEDKELRSRIEDLINKEQKYLRAEDIVLRLGLSSRSYLHYRGIDVTEVNESLGFYRRRPRDFRNEKNLLPKEYVETEVSRRIISSGRYLHYKDFRKSENGVSQYTLYKLGIDLHGINVKLGFFKKSSMAKFNLQSLTTEITKYIEKCPRFVSQQEICDTFNISLSFLTKSNIDTIALNAKVGKSNSCNYFEVLAVQVLRDLGIQDIHLQKTFGDCRSNFGFLLRFDIYLEEYNLLIELDGPQHWDEKHRFYKESTKINDETKTRYASSKGITLVRVPYNGRFKLKEYLKTKFLEVLESLQTKTDLETENVNVKNMKD